MAKVFENAATREKRKALLAGEEFTPGVRINSLLHTLRVSREVSTSFTINGGFAGAGTCITGTCCTVPLVDREYPKPRGRTSSSGQYIANQQILVFAVATHSKLSDCGSPVDDPNKMGGGPSAKAEATGATTSAVACNNNKTSWAELHSMNKQFGDLYLHSSKETIGRSRYSSLRLNGTLITREHCTITRMIHEGVQPSDYYYLLDTR